MSLPARIFRLSRAQFLPVVLSPILVGSVLAWWTDRAFNVLTFGLVVLGSVTAHLAANTIDDAYDYASGVDVVSNSMFPPDFGGWKPLPRGFITFGHAKLVAYLFFSVTILVGLYLTLVAGPLLLLLGAVGIFFAYFHVAPPLRLGYRGLGLSEIGIFLSFGVLPVIGSFYVQSSYVSTLSLITGMPLGLLTTSVLINHDQIFYDPYVKAGKRSFTVTVGRKPAMTTALILTLFSYAIVLAAALGKLIPMTTLLVFLTLPLFIMQTKLYTTPAQSPLHYVKLTQATFVLSIIFGGLLALGLAVG
jgi:1,4-dihydroxy-2-naphthoate octaprenyltransferase